MDNGAVTQNVKEGRNIRTSDQSRLRPMTQWCNFVTVIVATTRAKRDTAVEETLKVLLHHI